MDTLGDTRATPESHPPRQYIDKRKYSTTQATLRHIKLPLTYDLCSLSAAVLRDFFLMRRILWKSEGLCTCHICACKAHKAFSSELRQGAFTASLPRRCFPCTPTPCLLLMRQLGWVQLHQPFTSCRRSGILSVGYVSQLLLLELELLKPSRPSCLPAVVQLSLVVRSVVLTFQNQEHVHLGEAATLRKLLSAASDT